MIALCAPTSTTVEVKEPGPFYELGLVFLFFTFLLLEPWIKLASSSLDGISVNIKKGGNWGGPNAELPGEDQKGGSARFLFSLHKQIGLFVAPSV